ncbi:hypothetical protein [Mucilaginibacter sp. BT774]|uniref:hypothetical protein n=1 Tax=Mucilaginibacter sp. BT774 TaxID=3062276 RepID=UPI002674F3BB|nr:hypothetical protein [Mucilaginibacter sp. BT774]MDO3627553.1 hypothetical protein [Mucilaginibacter sp. BT774]
MKTTIKLGVAILSLAACQKANHDGTYVNHKVGQYSTADDTLIIRDTVITKKTGYQIIRDGKALPKNFETHIWTMNSPDAPVLQFKNRTVQLGPTIYTPLP